MQPLLSPHSPVDNFMSGNEAISATLLLMGLLFTYQIDLEKRLRPDHPLRQIAAQLRADRSRRALRRQRQRLHRSGHPAQDDIPALL
jgi:hypothetical protein